VLYFTLFIRFFSLFHPTFSPLGRLLAHQFDQVHFKVNAKKSFAQIVISQIVSLSLSSLTLISTRSFSNRLGSATEIRVFCVGPTLLWNW
jgi:hypothetical protein